MEFKNISISPSQSLPADYQSTQRATHNRNMSEKSQLHLDLSDLGPRGWGKSLERGSVFLRLGRI